MKVFTPELIAIEKIYVPQERRQVSPDVVAELTKSISATGLLHAISVVQEVRNQFKFRLVVGRHRLEACKNLGYEEISANVLSSEIEAKIVEAEENLLRSELTALERAEALIQCEAHYLELNKSAKKGGSPGVAGGGKAKNETISFAKSWGAKTKTSERSIQNYLRIGKQLSSEVKAKLREHHLDDDMVKLIRLTKIKSNEEGAGNSLQLEAIEKLLQPKKPQEKELKQDAKQSTVTPQKSHDPVGSKVYLAIMDLREELQNLEHPEQFPEVDDPNAQVAITEVRKRLKPFDRSKSKGSTHKASIIRAEA